MILERDAVRNRLDRGVEQLDHQHDLPDQREPGAARRGDERKELRQHDVAQQPRAREAEDLGHLLQLGIQRAGALAQGERGSDEVAADVGGWFDEHPRGGGPHAAGADHHRTPRRDARHAADQLAAARSRAPQ